MMTSPLERIPWIYPLLVTLFGTIQLPVPGTNKGSDFRQVPLRDVYLRSLFTGLRTRSSLGRAETYCMFLGYPRSGHSLVGSLLDAHPDMSIAHEADALRLVQAGFSRNQIFSYLIQNSKMFSQTNRNWTGYNYSVLGQWQGRFSALKVIGDKKGGTSTSRLQFHPGLLNRLRKIVKIPVKIIHYVRNPYDNISTMCLPEGLRARPAVQVVDRYFALCRTVAAVKKETNPSDFYEEKHEDFVRDPVKGLESLCRFLGVRTTEDYLHACASIVERTPRRSRRKLLWDKERIDRVEEEMKPYDFLRGYSFEKAGF